MNYQYTPQPQQVIDPAAYHAQKQARLFGICDKLGEFFKGNAFTRALMSFSDIITYILLGIEFVLSLIVLIASGTCTMYLPFTTLLFAALALGKRKVIPMAATLSLFGLLELGSIITIIVQMSTYGYFYNSGYMVGLVFGLIFAFLELAALVVLAIFLWMEIPFTMAYRPKVVAPVYVQTVPVQPTAPQPAAPTAPAQPVAPAAPQQAAPAQPTAPAQTGMVCPKCGAQNEAGSVFCKVCGNKLQ